MRRPPRLVPFFPVPSYVPLSICPHSGAIRRGSIFVCAVCWRSGFDHWDYFQPDYLLDPRPDPKPRRRRRAREKFVPLTRKQRRLLQFGPSS